MDNSHYKTKSFKIIAFIIVVLIGSIYIGKNQPALFTNFISTKAGPVAVVIGEVRQENVQLTYPQVEGLADGVVEKKINAQIINEVNTFKELVGQKDHHVDTRYSLEFNKNNMISLTLSESHYRKLAAHPMHYVKAMTMSTKTGRVYQLADVFKADSDYKTRLGAIINQQISDKGLHLFKPFEGIKDDQEFYLTDNAVVIYYQLYYYTPYVYGILKFNIPYEQITDIIYSDFSQ